MTNFMAAAFAANHGCNWEQHLTWSDMCHWWRMFPEMDTNERNEPTRVSRDQRVMMLLLAGAIQDEAGCPHPY